MHFVSQSLRHLLFDINTMLFGEIIVKKCTILSVFIFFLCFDMFIYAQTHEIVSGVTYTHITKQLPRNISIHILEVSPHKNGIFLEHALGYGTDREEVSSIVQRTHALAAVNGSNYRRGGRFNGNSVNLSIINNSLISDPAINRGTIGWDNKGNILIDCVCLEWHLKIGDKEYPIYRVNQPRADHEAILYTPTFRPSTLTNNHGIEIEICNDQIVAIYKSQGNAFIPLNGFIYSVGIETVIDLDEIAVGMPVALWYNIIPENATKQGQWKSMQTILGGAGILIQNGSINTNFDGELQKGTQICHSHDEIAADFHRDNERDWLINKPHPRTAIGIKPDGNWVFVVIDGRQPELSLGLTLRELAEYMQDLDCIQAINIGGGGCTTMYINDHVANSPSGHEERPVSEAFIIIPKKKK